MSLYCVQFILPGRLFYPSLISLSCHRINFPIKISCSQHWPYPWDALDVFKSHRTLKISHAIYTLPHHHTDRRLSQSWRPLSVVFSDPFALGIVLALDAAYNLWICGNREDFLSSDPLASSVHNPPTLSQRALLTRMEEGGPLHCGC